jgi:diaminohydroxyphosphoribosylaminopyrimidine deaminase/5-amino-6-(5-phosphoribosylamino)uracil reductase
VGTNTVLQDNPTLTARNWVGKNPIRVLIDKNKKLSKDFNIFNDEAKTIIISNNNIDFTKNIASQICNVLFEKNINSVIIEGGAKTLQTFIDENLWDEARVFTGNIQFNNGVKSPSFSGQLISEEKIDSDILKFYMND